MAFGVALGNPFALLGEDEENDDPQKINLPHAASAAPAKEDQPPEGGAARGGRGRVERGRGSRVGTRGRGRPEYSQRANDGYDAFEERPPSHATAGGGRYGGPGRGGEDRRGRGRGGKQRDFDRRDQSGRGSHELEKRGGGGKGNWGGAADSWEEIPAEESQPLENGVQPPAGGEQPADEHTNDTEAEVVAEPEEKEEVEKLTLAEYEEMRKQKLLTKVVKKAEVDMGQFKGLSKFVKDDVETGFEGLELEKTKKMKQKAKKEFIPVETGFRVGDPVRRGRGRGGPGRGGGGRGSRDLDREGSGGSWGMADTSDNNTPYNAGGSTGGGYRGGRGRGRNWDRRPGSYGGGGYRDNAAQPKQPSLDDQASFPSLA